MYEGPSLPPGGLPAPEEVKEEEKKKDEGEWYEAMSAMGYPYYWNTVTGGKLSRPRYCKFVYFVRILFSRISLKDTFAM